jgi:cell division protease FtsH
MSDKIGPVAYTTGDREVFLGKDYGSARNYSEKVAADIDDEIKSIITDAYNNCESIIRTHQDKLTEVAEYLIINEKADRKTFEAIMNGEFVADSVETQTDEDIPEAVEKTTEE